MSWNYHFVPKKLCDCHKRVILHVTRSYFNLIYYNIMKAGRSWEPSGCILSNSSSFVQNRKTSFASSSKRTNGRTRKDSPQCVWCLWLNETWASSLIPNPPIQRFCQRRVWCRIHDEPSSKKNFIDSLIVMSRRTDTRKPPRG